MQKIAVVGNAGGGKSTLSRRLSEITGLPLYVLDKMKYQAGGIPVSDEDFQHTHQAILLTDQWIIDGFGSMETLWLRLDQAECLIYIDLPLYVHFWWVTKRLFTGYFKPPAGWPEKSPILKSSINSYRALWLCHKYLTPRYRTYLQQVQQTKQVYHIRSTQELTRFWAELERKSNTGHAITPSEGSRVE